jgi:hypothetical protein
MDVVASHPIALPVNDDEQTWIVETNISSACNCFKSVIHQVAGVTLRSDAISLRYSRLTFSLWLTILVIVNGVSALPQSVGHRQYDADWG